VYARVARLFAKSMGMRGCVCVCEIDRERKSVADKTNVGA